MEIRVLVVDDSAFARKVMREVLETSPELEVVGTARDGLEALERIAETAPDVVTLDLVMPNLDGLGVLRALPAHGAPRVIVVSISDAESNLGVAALQAGAVDLVLKPTALATDRLYELGQELIAKVKAAAYARPLAAAPRVATSQLPSRLAYQREKTTGIRRELVVIGTSTGGPQALTRLLSALPADFPVPIAIALHIPAGYTFELARRLNEECAISVREAEHELPLRPGLAILARGGVHLKVERWGSGARTRLDVEPSSAVHSPSVDVLFDSAAAAFGAGTLGIVLTGMGDDGLRGCRTIHAAQGRILTESEASCVVYGMPRCVVEAGLSAAEVTIDEMASALMRNL